jgi:hypothetical protein
VSVVSCFLLEDDAVSAASKPARVHADQSGKAKFRDC